MTLLDCLDGQERNVMEYRFGYGLSDGKGMDYTAIGKLLGVTGQRICDIERDALARIVQASRKHHIEKMRTMFTTKIGVLNFKPRTHNMLIGSGILFVEQLAAYTRKDLSMVPGIGKAMMDEIEKKLNRIGKPLVVIPSQIVEYPLR